MTPTTSKRALEEPLDELTKRALGLGILALLFASWGGIFLIEWIVVHGGVPPEVAAITSSMEVDDWVALAVTALPLLSLFVALCRGSGVASSAPGATDT